MVLSWTHVLVEASPAGQQPGYITTFAGNGQSGHGGDHGLATEASFGAAAVVVAKNGDVYVLDSGAHVVRKITKSTGIITTIAGIPDQSGFSGDGGPATSAKFNYPVGFYFDELNGSLYIADTNNHRIRMVDSAGTISTVAGNGVEGFSGDGGLATSASLKWPRSIIGNDRGELFFADIGNRRIRKVGVDKMISTIAGDGNYADFIEGEEATKSPLVEPTSLVLNDEGELLFVSTYSLGAFVLKIGIDGRLLKVAGNGENGFAGDGGPAVDASFGDASSLVNDISIALGKGGEVYIADTYNYRIRMINSAGIISTIAGDGQDRHAGDGGPATEASFTVPNYVSVAPNGDLYVCDFNRVRVIYASSMSCFGLNSEDPNVCSGYGSCTGIDQCKCREGWMGIDCSITHCFGVTSNLPDLVCSGKGTCVKPDECHCNPGHRGHKCQRT